MEKREKIKMPAGAIIACILIILFLLGLAAGAGLLLSEKVFNRNHQTAHATEPPAAEQTEAPGREQTAAPSVDPALVTPAPSSSLIEGGTEARPGTAMTDIIANCMSTVVSIDITMMNGSEDVYAGSGSGVIITTDGYIVTCNHVVEGAANIYVYLNDGRRCDAELIGNDPVTDIAVIKLKSEGVSYPCATIGSSIDLRVGDNVFAIGNALGELSNTVTEGIISGLDRDMDIEGQSMTLLQTSAAINSGNSGGALFLENGDLIGIVNAKSSGETSSGATIEGIGFAVPIDLAKPIIRDIMDYGFVTGRPYLGVTTKNVSYGFGMFSYYTYPKVISVIEGSPADIAGIKEEDVIIEINGETISSSTMLRVKINSFKVGDEITVTIQRGNETIDLQVTLLERKSK